MAFEAAFKKFAALRNEVEDHFEELLEEMRRRFGREDAEANEIFRPLPDPEVLSVTLTEALAARRSERSFSTEPLSDQHLSNILYAADGINRPNGRRTTPSALDWQDTEIYVLKKNGIWRWVPERRGLIYCSMDDVRSESCYAQPTVARAPVQLVYVSNRTKTRSFITDLAERIFEHFGHDVWTPEKIEEMRVRATHINVGVKIEAAALAAAAMELACVSRTGFDAEALGRALHLEDEEFVVAAQSIGYRPKSLLDHLT